MARDVWGNYVAPEDFEAAAERGICRQTVKNRIALGWKAKDAVSIPVMKTSEEYKHFRALAVSNGIKANTFKRRVQRGWKLEEAATLPLVEIKESTARGRKNRKRVISETAIGQAAKNGICYSTLYSRLRLGIPMSQAVSIPVMKSSHPMHPWRRRIVSRMEMVERS